MGLDMRPMGKPVPGFELRFAEIFHQLTKLNIADATNNQTDQINSFPSRDELLKEWFANQIPSYETIKAPRVGRDPEADEWLKTHYDLLENRPSFDQFVKENAGYYVIELAREQDGVPVYVSPGQDRNVFRGQFLLDCTSLIGEELVKEAWNTKLAADALEYGTRLMAAADSIAHTNNLLYIKEAYFSPTENEDAIESQLHIVYSLAKWLIFYGSNGHGYEADF